MSAGNIPVRKVSARKVPVKEVSDRKVPVREVSARKMPVRDVSAWKIPVREVSARKIPDRELSDRTVPVMKEGVCQGRGCQEKRKEDGRVGSCIYLGSANIEIRSITGGSRLKRNE